MKRTLIALALLSAVAGCGYRLESGSARFTDPSVRMDVSPFANRSTTPDAGAVVAASFREELRRSGFRGTFGNVGANYLVEGTVREVRSDDLLPRHGPVLAGEPPHPGGGHPGGRGRPGRGSLERVRPDRDRFLLFGNGRAVHGGQPARRLRGGRPPDGRPPVPDPPRAPVKPADPPPIFREWLSGDPAPAYLLYGDGAGLAGLLARSWEGKLRGEGVPIESFRWTLEDLARESPTAAWRSPSFFSRVRIFTLPDIAEMKKAHREEIKAYLESPEPSATLILHGTDFRQARGFSGTRNLLSDAPREEKAVEALARHAVAVAAEGGAKLTRESALFLARWVGGLLRRPRRGDRQGAGVCRRARGSGRGGHPGGVRRPGRRRSVPAGRDAGAEGRQGVPLPVPSLRGGGGSRRLPQAERGGGVVPSEQDPGEGERRRGHAAAGRGDLPDPVTDRPGDEGGEQALPRAGVRDPSAVAAA